MLKIDEGGIKPGGYVELSETTLDQLEMVAPIFEGEGGRLSAASERLIDLGHGCGRIIAANCDIEACEAIRTELTANMNETVARGFSLGYVDAVRFEKQIPQTLEDVGGPLAANP